MMCGMGQEGVEREPSWIVFGSKMRPSFFDATDGHTDYACTVDVRPVRRKEEYIHDSSGRGSNVYIARMDPVGLWEKRLT